jgi:hypothetical protein
MAFSSADSPEEKVAPAFKTFPSPSYPTSKGFTTSQAQEYFQFPENYLSDCTLERLQEREFL